MGFTFLEDTVQLSAADPIIRRITEHGGKVYALEAGWFAGTATSFRVVEFSGSPVERSAASADIDCGFDFSSGTTWITSDGTWLYVTIGVASGDTVNSSVMYRINPADLTIAGTLYLNQSQDRLAEQTLIYNGFAYILCWSRRIAKVNLATFTRVVSIQLNVNEYCQDACILNDTLYVVNFSSSVVEVDLATFTRTTAFPFDSGVIVTNIVTDGTDLFAAVKADPAVVYRMSVGPLAIEDTLVLDHARDPLANWQMGMLVDAAHENVYVFTFDPASPYGMYLERVATDTFTKTGEVQLPNNSAYYNWAQKVPTDGTTAWVVYFVANVMQVLPIDLGSLTVGTLFHGWTGTAKPKHAVVANGYLYSVGNWGTMYKYSGICKLDLSDFATEEFLAITSATQRIESIASDGTYLYVLMQSTVGDVISKVAISTFTEVLQANITGASGAWEIVHKDGYLYIAAWSGVKKIDASDLSVVDSINPGWGAGKLALGAANELVYVSVGSIPERIAVIDLVSFTLSLSATALVGNGCHRVCVDGGYAYVCHAFADVAKVDLTDGSVVDTTDPVAGLWGADIGVYGGYLFRGVATSGGSSVEWRRYDLATLTEDEAIVRSPMYGSGLALAVDNAEGDGYLVWLDSANREWVDRFGLNDPGMPITPATFGINVEALKQTNASQHQIPVEALEATNVSQLHQIPVEALEVTNVSQLHQIPVEAGRRFTPVQPAETVVSLAAVLYPNSDDIERALAGEGTGEIKLYPELARSDIHGNVVEDLSPRVISGSVSVKRSEVISRTAQFILKDLDGISLETDYFRPVWVLDVNGIMIEFPQGIYRATAPSGSRSEKDKRVTIICQDLSSILTDPFQYPYTLPAGITYRQGLETIWGLTKMKDNSLLVPGMTEVIPNDFTWGPPTPFAIALNDLLQGVNYLPIYVSKDKGQGLSRPRTLLKQRNPDVTYGSDAGLRIVAAPFEYNEDNRTDHRNEIIVEVNDPLREQFWATYYVENGLSPIVIPWRHGFLLHDTADYWEAPNLNGASIVSAATGSGGLPTFNPPGTVALGGWVYVDENDTGKVIGGLWDSAQANSTIVLMANGENGGPAVGVVTNPTSNLASGSVTKWIEGPAPLSTGWHRISAVYTPGGHIGPNAINNPGFEAGDTAPGVYWEGRVASGYSYAFDNDESEGVRAVKMVDASATNAGAMLSQEVMLPVPIPVGSRIRFSYDRKVLESSSHVLTPQIQYKVRYSNGTLSDWSNIVGLTSMGESVTPGSWETKTFLSSSLYPTTLEVVAFKIWFLFSNNFSATQGSVLIDNVKVSAGTAPYLTLLVDGVAVASTSDVQAFLHAVNTNTFKLGGPAHGWDSGDANDAGTPARRIHDFGVWYGSAAAENTATVEAQETAIFQGIWPPNVPYTLAYWRGTSTSPTPAFDNTNHGYTLFPENGANEEEINDFPASVGTRDRFLANPDDVIHLPRTPDQAHADAAARIFAEENASGYMRAKLVTTVDPRRDLHEIYAIRLMDVNGDIVTDDNWVVDGWTMDFRTGGRMTHELKRIEES